MLYAIRFLNIFLPLLYLGLMALNIAWFVYQDQRARLHKKWLLPTTLALHLLELILRGLYNGYFPIATVFEAASVLAFCLMLVYYVVEHLQKVQTTGPFFLIIAFILKLFSSAFVEFSGDISPLLSSGMFILHTSAAMLSYSTIFAASIYALMYLLLFYQIRSARYGLFYRRLPTLEQLELLNSRALTLGFLLLTFLIFQGVIWRKSLFPEDGHFDPQVVFAYAIWVLYGVTLLVKRFAALSGKWLAICTISGFLLILTSLVTVNFILSSFHRFH